MSRSSRKLGNKLFSWLCLSIAWSTLLILAILLFHILLEGWAWFDWDFIDSFPSRFPEKAGLKSALWGSLWIMGMTALIAVPLGVASAIFLEEYAPQGRITQWIQINIGNLAGMPSIVYGLVGLAIFVRYFELDRSLLAGSMTLSLLALPIIIISSQESIRAVPRSLREAAYALGARRWQVVFLQVLPAALPGIMTGVILSLSRAIGETAPLIVIGALSYVAFVPESPMDPFTILPVQIYNWAARPQEAFHGLAAGGIMVLLILLFTLNCGAVLIRQKYQKYKL